MWCDANPNPHDQPVRAKTLLSCFGGNSTRGNLRDDPVLSFPPAAVADSDPMIDGSDSEDCRDEIPVSDQCILTCILGRNRTAFSRAVPSLLRGQGCLVVNGHRHSLGMTFEMFSVPSIGSFIHAILCEIYCWGEEVCERLQHHLCQLDFNFDWTIFFSRLMKWREFGKQSMMQKDFSLFRQHVARLLLDDRNAAACLQFFERELTEDDLCGGDMDRAEAIASSLGLKFGLDIHVHRWAVAILHPNFQVSIEILQFLLQVEFDGRLGIATVIQELSTEKAVMNSDICANPENLYSYSISAQDQPLMQTRPGVCIVMAVLQGAGAFPRTSKDPGISTASPFSRLSIKHGHHEFPLWVFVDSDRAANVSAKRLLRFDPNDDAENCSRAGSGPTDSHERVDSSSMVGLDGRVCSLGSIKILTKLYNIYRKTDTGASGTVGCHGFGGSIGPTGVDTIFRFLDLEGRNFMDIGAGDARLAVAAGCYGASKAFGVELAVNTGYFLIFKAVIASMEKDPYWCGVLRLFPFDIRNSLLARDFDEVS